MARSQQGPSASSKPSHAEFFRSPWNEETLRSRRDLLLAGTAGLAVSAAGIVPKEISGFGLKVEDIDQRAFLIILALITLYLTVNYAMSTYSDFMQSFIPELFRVESTALRIATMTGEKASSAPEDIITVDLVADLRRTIERLKNVHVLRVIFDISVPVLLGLVALAWLLSASLQVSADTRPTGNAPSSARPAGAQPAPTSIPSR